MFLFNIILLQSELIFDGEGVYCNRDMTELFAPILLGTGIYCNRNMSNLFTSPLLGTGVYCSQDLSAL
jgi:hypothetical protein